MVVRAWLAKAGPFDVEVVHVPDAFTEPANFDAPPAGILHTMEGSFSSGLSVFQQHYAPHFAVGPNKIVQMLPVGLIGLALKEHNNLARVQIEVEGFSKETPWMFPDEVAARLAALMAACCDEYGIPLSRPWADGVYGMARASDPHRNDGHFGHTAGWFGHGDCPAPDSHWDPGCLQWSKLFALAAAIPRAPTAASMPAPPRPCAAAQLDGSGPVSLQDKAVIMEGGLQDKAQTTPAAANRAFDLSTVAGIQRALNALGYRLTVDGELGPDTRYIVRSFQLHAGLAADGDPGPLTQSALKRELEKTHA